MTPALLPALPPDAMGCVARAALTAEGSTAKARARLSLVCRRWRESLRGPHHFQVSTVSAHCSDECIHQPTGQV